MRALSVKHVYLGCALVLLASYAVAESANSLIGNGGFEELVRAPGVADTGGKSGSWVLKAGPQAPAGWTLSGWFGGTLTVLSEGAPEGKHYLRIQGTAEREAHIHRECPGIWAGGCYKVSIRYRGGPVKIKAYEYKAGESAPRIPALATGEPTEGEWRRIEQTYAPLDLDNVRLVAAVDASSTADIDDFRVWQTEPEVEPDASGWLNVKNHGVCGSAFETKAKTTAGSRDITVATPGDFKPRQQVTVSLCHARFINKRLRGAKWRYPTPVKDEVELRGYDGSAGSWLVFTVEVDSAKPLTFRWSDDIRKDWNAKNVPITYEWQPLSSGIEVRFSNKVDWALGDMLTFSARDQLVSKIERIVGKVVTLSDAPSRSVEAAVMRHCDSDALQGVIDQALRGRKNVYLPNGHYRLVHGLEVKQPQGMCIEGASAVHTVLDISQGEGSILGLRGGVEATVRNLRMIGHTGLADKPRDIRTVLGRTFWRCVLKRCNAASITGTDRVLFENIHATRMSSECFYCHSPDALKPREDKSAYTKSLTFLRCWVSDCAANAFNNNDTSENTHVLYCRVEDVGWLAYEGPARFIKIVGNYMRNSGPFWVGSMNHRAEHLNDLGCGQAIIANNVIEGTNPRSGILVHNGATQVTIANNLFINFNGTAAIQASVGNVGYPSQNVLISNNIIDLTHLGKGAKHRTGIHVSASDVTVSNNQVYVRGEPDQRVTGIRIDEPAVNVTVHDNLVRNCRYGIKTGRASSTVTEVIDAATFAEGTLPRQWLRSHLYRHWRLAWLTGKARNTVSVIESYDPKAVRFRLTKPHKMQVGDRFEVYAPSANWRIQSNTVTDCIAPVCLESHGSPTSAFRDNLVSRGRATGVKEAVVVAGRFDLVGNQIFGFDEPGSAGLSLQPDPIGRVPGNMYRDNIFERCSAAVKECRPGLWQAAERKHNMFLGCGDAPKAKEPATPAANLVPVVLAVEEKRSFVLLAARAAAAITTDGDVGDWPMSDNKRATKVDLALNGDVLDCPQGRVCVAWDEKALYIAASFTVTKGTGEGDVVEVSMRNADPKRRTPIFVFVGKSDGTFKCLAIDGGADRVAGLEKSTKYAARRDAASWSSEWCIPFAAMGMNSEHARVLRFNIGMHSKDEGCWVAWVLTGGRICDVDSAGELRLAP